MTVLDSEADSSAGCAGSAPTPDGGRWSAKEWLVTNGLGGYASGTIAGALTRRYHGLLVAALPTPFGRTVMLNTAGSGCAGRTGASCRCPRSTDTAPGTEFDRALSDGVPARSGLAGLELRRARASRFEKRVLMPHLQNTTHVSYRLLSTRPVRLELRPLIAFRLHEAPVNHPVAAPYALQASAIASRSRLAAICRRCACCCTAATRRSPCMPETLRATSSYALEQNRGYECCGESVDAGLLPR